MPTAADEPDPTLLKFIRSEHGLVVLRAYERGYLWVGLVVMGGTGLAIAMLSLVLALVGGPSAWREVGPFVLGAGFAGIALTAVGIIVRTPWRFELDRASGSIRVLRRGQEVDVSGGLEFIVFESLVPRTHETGRRQLFNVLAMLPDGRRIPVAHSYETSELSHLIDYLTAVMARASRSVAAGP